MSVEDPPPVIHQRPRRRSSHSLSSTPSSSPHSSDLRTLHHSIHSTHSTSGHHFPPTPPDLSTRHLRSDSTTSPATSPAASPSSASAPTSSPSPLTPSALSTSSSTLPSSHPSSPSPSPPTPSQTSSSSPVDRFRSSLQLKMYRNQVAGHSPLFWHSGTICKPLIPAEYDFYAALERDMPAFVPFVPKFYGMLDLEQLTEEMASSMVSTQGGNEMEGRGEGEAEVKQDVGEEKRQLSESDGRSSPSSASQSAEKAMTLDNRLYNKWAMKCRLRKPNPSKASIQYIVLEDLTYAYAKPCILDLKVGTRQHADTEPPSKIASKTARCLHTTSSTLGLRLCGMQVYHPKEEMYCFRDKYYGRSLDAAGFEQALHEYFFDGERIVEEVVRAFIGRMEKMRRAVLQWTRGRRFYSSSLLLVYEGDNKSRGAGAAGAGDLDKTPLGRQESDSTLSSQGKSSPGWSPPRHIDPVLASPMSATTTSQVLTPTGSSGPSASSPSSVAPLSSSLPSSSAVPTGRATLPASFSSSMLSTTFPSTPSPTSSDTSTLSSSSSSPPAPPPIKLYSHKRKTTHAQAMALARQRGNIDVRIIDFAHTSVVEGDKAGKAEHDRDEVDTGLILGFDNLLALLKKIIAEQTERRQREQRERERKEEEDEEREIEEERKGGREEEGKVAEVKEEEEGENEG